MTREDVYLIVFKKVAKRHNITSQEVRYGYIENANEVGCEVANLRIKGTAFMADVFENYVNEQGLFVIESFECKFSYKTKSFSYEPMERYEQSFEIKDAYEK